MAQHQPISHDNQSRALPQCIIKSIFLCSRVGLQCHQNNRTCLGVWVIPISYVPHIPARVCVHLNRLAMMLMMIVVVVVVAIHSKELLSVSCVMWTKRTSCAMPASVFQLRMDFTLQPPTPHPFSSWLPLPVHSDQVCYRSCAVSQFSP